MFFFNSCSNTFFKKNLLKGKRSFKCKIFASDIKYF